MKVEISNGDHEISYDFISLSGRKLMLAYSEELEDMLNNYLYEWLALCISNYGIQGNTITLTFNRDIDLDLVYPNISNSQESLCIEL